MIGAVVPARRLVGRHRAEVLEAVAAADHQHPGTHVERVQAERHPSRSPRHRRRVQNAGIVLVHRASGLRREVDRRQEADVSRMTV